MNHRVLVIPLVFWVVVTACGQPTTGRPDDEAGLTSPSVAPATYDELVNRRVSTPFGVLYDAKWQGRDGQLFWRNADGYQRWDFAYKLLSGRQTSESMLTVGGNPGGACWIKFKDQASADVICTTGSVSTGFESTLVDSFEVLAYRMSYIGDRETLGQTVHCYRADLGIRYAGESCMTDEGVPLRLDVAVGVNGPASLRAIAVSPPPVLDDMRELPWASADGVVPVSDLKLPPIPSLDEYLGRPSTPVGDTP